MEIWKANWGEVPEDARGKRVMVILKNGLKVKESWPADGGSYRSPPVRWTLTGDDWDIDRYRVV